MGEIYIKWQKLSGSANNINGCCSKLSGYKNRVTRVRDHLAMSERLSDTIRGSLTRDAKRLEELEQDLRAYSRALSDISELYRSTEKQNLNN